MYPGLRYALKKLNFACKNFFWKNVCLSSKFDLLVKKNNKFFLMQFQIKLEKFLGRHQKNASDSVSIYGNCMMNIFYKKQKPRFFHHQTVLLESNRRRS